MKLLLVILLYWHGQKEDAFSDGEKAKHALKTYSFSSSYSLYRYVLNV